MPRRTKWAVAGLFVLLFAACGNDDESPPAPSGGTAGSSAGGGGAGDGGSAGGGDGGSDGGGEGGDGDGGTTGGSSGSAGSSGSGGTAGAAGAAGADDGGGGGTDGEDDVIGTEGGTISDAEGNLTLIIPPGALLGDTRFTFNDVASPTGLPSELDFVENSGHRAAWTLAGFAPGAAISARISLPDMQQSTGDELAVPLPFCMAVQCADGSWATSDCVLINGGTLAMDVAPVCLESAGALTFVVTTPTPTAMPPNTTDPANVTVGAGDPSGFSVTGTGSPPLRYQWRRNGTDIPGATNASYGFSVTYPSDNGGRFSVRVSNAFGTVTSNEATLTVGPPRTPTWSTFTPFNTFATDVDLPQVGSLTGLDFVVWNEAGTLHAKVARGGSYAPIDTLAEPARGRPKVLTGGNLNLAYIAFVDDSGSSCAGTLGNRLSAVGVRIGSEGQMYPRSSRFTLYESATECIAQFSAALVDTDFATARPIGFAVTEFGTGALKVGAGGALYQDSTSSWSVTAPVLFPLTLATGCTGGASITAESLAGRREGFSGGTVPATTAVLTWVSVANENLCAATLDGGTWSQGSVVFDQAIGDPSIGPPEPVAAIDADGKALVVASRVTNATTTPYTQAMTAAFRAATGGAWDVDALDSSPGIALPSAVFGGTISSRPENAQFAGSALVVWRPSLAAAPTTVYAAVRSPNGTWTSAQPISASAAADTRFPRVCVDYYGNALAVYQEKATASDPFQVWGRIWSGGAWSAPGRVQNNANEGRFAECVKHQFNPYLAAGAFVAWRETNPSDATQFRIVSATP